MDKCRICLSNKKTLLCVFERDDKISFSEMMCSIANVKIVKDDGTPDKICRPCRRSLKDAYKFKLLIERSDAALNESVKRIKFDNLCDVKLQIEIEIDSTPAIETCTAAKLCQKDGIDEFHYNNTVIKKVASPSVDDICNKPVPVLEFLRTLKDVADDDTNILDHHNFNDDGVAMDCYGIDSGDEEYIPPYKMIDTGRVKRIRRPNKSHVNEVCLKPVYLRDLKLIYSKPTESSKPCGRPKISKRQDQLICPYCGVIKKSLKSHMLVHTGERKHKCTECTKKFFSEAALKSHKNIKHATTKDFKCDKCTAAFPTKTCLLRHNISHNSKRNHVCDICSKAFKRKAAMWRHLRGHNSANKTVMCDLCNMSFFSKSALQHHLRIHTGERPYKCEICSQPYSYKHDFNRHCLKKHGVCFKRRSICVMNEEVLKQERMLMRDLMLRFKGVIKDDKPVNPFEGPQAALAFEQTLKALQSGQIQLDLQF